MTRTIEPIEIIHIEDDPDWCQEVRGLVGENCVAGISSYTTSTSVDALRSISSHGHPCIVIVDLRLGDDASGYGGLFWLLEELESCTKINPQMEIFVLSGQLNEGIVAALIRRSVQREHIFEKGYWVENRERFVKAVRNASYRLMLEFGTAPLGNKIDRPARERIDDMISVLFLAADPTDASRSRQGEELREIQERMQLGKLRDRFQLHQRMSVRVVDISQALLDLQPNIVHFSGHATATGALCFESPTGETQPVRADALAALFEHFANQTNCVVLNACYTEIQARAIASHINYVIGTRQAIGDKAGIAFAIGFYQALGAGRSVEEAYELGCVQIGLQGSREYLTPILIKKGQTNV